MTLALAAIVAVKTATLEIKLTSFASGLERRYRPDQPRAPAGSPIGGQWIADVGGDAPASSEPQRVAQRGDQPRYRIDLAAEDAKGGHGYRKHVGRTRQQLRAVMSASLRRVRYPDGSVEYFWHPAEGTFRSAGEANYWVERALLAHPDLVARAINGRVGEEITITHRFGAETGFEAYQADYFSEVVFRPTFWVTVFLTRDPNQRGRGFRIVTAFPMNEIPDEVPR